MEFGAPGLSGRLGDGDGNWRLLAFTDGMIEVMAMLESPSGPIANLAFSVSEDHEISLFPSASDPLRQGLLHITSDSGNGEVQIYAADDAGQGYGPVSLHLKAEQTVTLSSSDLETGNAAKGLPVGVGSGTGDWRVWLQSESDLEVLVYVRTQDGFMTAIDAVAAQGNLRHHVPFFNPASETQQASRLRLINPEDRAAEIVIRAWDDGGNAAPTGAVRLTLAAGASRSVSAESLENGSEGLTGNFGDGKGRWRLTVQADRDIRVMSLVEDSIGYLTNVSTYSNLPKFFNSCVGGPVDSDRDGVSDHCDQDTRTVLRPLSQCANSSYISDPDLNPGLVSDCRVLIGFANLQAQGDDLPDDHVLRRWGMGDQAMMDSWNGIEISDARVTEVRLSGTSEQRGALTGFIPPELGQMSELTVLYLSYNQLIGPIPATFGRLTRLANLDLSYNQLSGRIPSELGHLARLQLLRLNNNRLSGRIPPELGRLASLSYLWLARNQLMGPIPSELGQLSRLIQLWLGENELTGSIPPELGDLIGLTYLSVYSNRLTGVIPSRLGNLNNLRTLGLARNQLTGPIPSELGGLNALMHLEAFSNKFTGSIPAELGQLTTLTQLLLYANELTGPIPEELGNLTNLAYLRLYSNRLSGSIPPQLGNLTNLRDLNLSRNALTGSIPAELGRLNSLTYMNLESNSLTGVIPPELGNIVNLDTLGLSSNQLSGVIPAELAELAVLRHLNLGSNQLTGSIPAEIGSLENLRHLSLSSNQLTGSIPVELGSLANLRHLNLSSNQLTGSIPAEIGSLENLEELFVNKNRFAGLLPWVFWKRVTRGDLVIHYVGNAIGGFEPPPQRNVRAEFSENAADNGNASHHSVAFYQGPLIWEWDWQNDAVEHQQPLLGRWAALAVRIEHEVREPPLVITRVLDREDAVLAERLAEAAPPTTVSVGSAQWRTEYVFQLPGALYRASNQIVHVIDPDNEMAETDEQDNVSESIRLYGVEPPPFRVTFIPLHFTGKEAPEVDAASLMAGTWAYWPIGDDFEAQIGSPVESDAEDKFDLLDEVTALWNAEADPDEFYHGVFNFPWPASMDFEGRGGGVAVRPGRVAVSEISVHNVIPHELGHNLSLQHTPGCGAGSIDENYPYPDGALGLSPGWDLNWRRLISRDDSGYKDVMSYCRRHSFVSDYHYRKASDYWRSTGSAADMSAVQSTVQIGVGSRFTPASANQPPANPRQADSGSETAGALALSGRIDSSGAWSLTHAQVSEKAPRPPAPDGAHTLVLIDGDGNELYRELLSVNVFSEGGEASWAARTPIPLRPAREVAIIDAQGVAVLREELPVLE